ncbi:DUF4169 family protein [Minwuia thermotolerans]|uniref:DUF4169 domain-containing protein n=1 Tax=Minwuia thermotolerans TaxID=2056226 RepID=A0A2M9FWN9_9PROT|nr:DUF4169 family protein [Minwuia thermotolerans]ANK83558.1 MAG: hypothetical protein TEF_16575 [Rhizobiales bacterium NRL2]PJK27876.1 DUF4169 domain-containing protein [Minwuia thermotolerans]
MAEIVSLNRFRKTRERARAAARAAENRVRHGRTGVEKRRDADAAARRERLLEGGRLTDDSDGDGGTAGAPSKK